MRILKTSDEATAQNLRKQGLMELNKEGAYFVFVSNDDKQTFSDNKIVYTNKLSF